MTANRYAIFPQDEPEQQLRLRRFFLAFGSYALNLCFVIACWQLDFYSAHNVAVYALLALAINLSLFLILRSGLNKRFPDPSLTNVQMAVAALSALYPLYYGGEVRGAFLMLGTAMFAYGIFRFRTRGFINFSLFMLTCYGALIGLLLYFRPQEVHLRIEALQWTALLVVAVQFTYVASYISHLRRKLRLNNQELEKQNAALADALQRIGDMAIRDELTGVYNRRYLTERINQETHRSTRHGALFCIYMFDIDHFKKVNDTFGHLAGDEVLKRVATTISEALRKTDVFGRFGGEEFVALLTDTPAEGAMVSAGRLRQRIEQLHFPEIDPALKVTVSIGIAEHARGSKPELTFKRADEALYRAKEGGRNRCVIATVDYPAIEGKPQDTSHAPLA